MSPIGRRPNLDRTAIDVRRTVQYIGMVGNQFVGMTLVIKFSILYVCVFVLPFTRTFELDMFIITNVH